MSLLSFIFLVDVVSSAPVYDTQRDEGSAAVVLGSDLSIINKAARRKGLNLERLNCYEVSIFRQGKTVVIGFVPKTAVIVVDGKLQAIPNVSCKAYSLLYTTDGQFVKHLGIREHSSIR